MSLPRPKRRKRSTIIDSSSDEDATFQVTTNASGKVDGLRDGPVRAKALPSRARSKLAQSKDPPEDGLAALPEKAANGTKVARKLPSKTLNKTSNKRSIRTFFASAIDRQKSTQDADLTSIDELDDSIQDDLSLEETRGLEATQNPNCTFRGFYRQHDGSSQQVSRRHTPSLPAGSQKFIQRPKADLESRSSRATPSRAHECEDTRPWVDKYAPTSLSELAVHKKKVDDVRRWLQDVYQGRSRKRLLVLKGPSGTGKTTTLSLLARSMGVEVLEWRNPTVSEYSPEGYVSVSAQFEDFINRGGKYNELDLSSNHELAVKDVDPSSQPFSWQKQKLILVEEVPNTLMRQTAPLQQLRLTIQQFLDLNTPSLHSSVSSEAESHTPVTPLVIIICETILSGTAGLADSFTVHRLLGQDILGHPGVSTIEFNPIARTLLNKALEVVIRKHGDQTGKRDKPSLSVLEKLGEVGDVRSAVGNLEFLYLMRDPERQDETAKPAAKLKRSVKGTKETTKIESGLLESVTQREASIGMFHAAGKVVYNKRDEMSDPDVSLQPLAQPPGHLSDHARSKKSQVSVDELIDQTGTDVDTFICVLHENYVLSCNDPSPENTLDSINGCIDALSDCDLLHLGYGGGARESGISAGTGRDTVRQDEMCFQIAVRGILFALPYPVKRRAPPPPKRNSRNNSGAGSKSRDVYKMFYPASLRLWRRREEVEGIMDRWISHFGIEASCTSTISSSGVVESWKNRMSRTAAGGSNVDDLPKADEVSSCRLTAPPSRVEMALERMPCMARIYKAKQSSSNTLVPELEKATMFTGLEDRDEDYSEPDQDVADEAMPQSKRAALAGRASAKSAQHASQRDVVISSEPAVNTIESALWTETMGDKLVLSDDDIEDD